MLAFDAIPTCTQIMGVGIVMCSRAAVSRGISVCCSMGAGGARWDLAMGCSIMELVLFT